MDFHFIMPNSKFEFDLKQLEVDLGQKLNCSVEENGVTTIIPKSTEIIWDMCNGKLK